VAYERVKPTQKLSN